MQKIKSCCDICLYYEYDDELGEYICSVDMDEDDFAAMRLDSIGNSCPYYRPGDEYKIVQKQI